MLKKLRLLATAVETDANVGTRRHRARRYRMLLEGLTISKHTADSGMSWTAMMGWCRGFFRWRSGALAMPWRDDPPPSTFLPPPPPSRILNQDLVLTFVRMKSLPSPKPSHPRRHFLRVLGNLCECCRQPRGSDCTAVVPREPVTPSSVPPRLFSQSRKRRLLFQPL